MSHVIQSFKSLLKTLVIFSEVKKNMSGGLFFLEYLGILGADHCTVIYKKEG